MCRNFNINSNDIYIHTSTHNLSNKTEIDWFKISTINALENQFNEKLHLFIIQNKHHNPNSFQDINPSVMLRSIKKSSSTSEKLNFRTIRKEKNNQKINKSNILESILCFERSERVYFVNWSNIDSGSVFRPSCPKTGTIGQ